MAASSAGLTPICTLALLGVYIFIEGVSKVQYFSFTPFDPIASGGCHLVALCQSVWTLAMLVIPICIDASRAGLIPILICMLAMLDIHMLIEGMSKAQHYSFISLDLVLPVAATLWPYTS